jgi:hypothetical protein
VEAQFLISSSPKSLSTACFSAPESPRRMTRLYQLTE